MKYLTGFSYIAGQETFQNYQKLLGKEKKKSFFQPILILLQRDTFPRLNGI